MSIKSVVVHDIDKLEEFGRFLKDKYEEIEELYDTLLENTTEEEENWNDPQYEFLKDKVEEYEKASRSQLEVLDDATKYIKELVYKLRDL